MNQINKRISELLTYFIDNANEFDAGVGSNKYELSLCRHLANGLGIPFITSEEFHALEKPGFCRSNIVMPEDFHAVVHEPFSSQSGPDVAIFVNGRMLPIEMKTGQSKKPVFNSVPPKPGRLFIFVHIPKNKKKPVRAFGFDGVIFDIPSNTHERIHARLKRVADEINAEFGLNNGKLSLYNRAMYNCDLVIDRHYPEFDDTVLDWTWDFLDFGSLVDANESQSAEEV